MKLLLFFLLKLCFQLKRKKYPTSYFTYFFCIFHKFNNNSSKNQPYHHNHSFLFTSTRPYFPVSSLHRHNSTIFVSFTLCLVIISTTTKKNYHTETKSFERETVKHTNVAVFSINIFVLHLYFSSLRLYFTFL